MRRRHRLLCPLPVLLVDPSDALIIVLLHLLRPARAVLRARLDQLARRWIASQPNDLLFQALRELVVCRTQSERARGDQASDLVYRLVALGLGIGLFSRFDLAADLRLQGQTVVARVQGSSHRTWAVRAEP